MLFASAHALCVSVLAAFATLHRQRHRGLMHHAALVKVTGRLHEAVATGATVLCGGQGHALGSTFFDPLGSSVPDLTRHPDDARENSKTVCPIAGVSCPDMTPAPVLRQRPQPMDFREGRHPCAFVSGAARRPSVATATRRQGEGPISKNPGSPSRGPGFHPARPSPQGRCSSPAFLSVSCRRQQHSSATSVTSDCGTIWQAPRSTMVGVDRGALHAISCCVCTAEGTSG